MADGRPATPLQTCAPKVMDHSSPKLSIFRIANQLVRKPPVQRMAWGVLWGCASRLSPFVSLAICARVLGAEKFGGLAALTVVVATAVSLAGLGLQIITVRLVTEAVVAKADPSEAAFRGIGAGSLFALAAGALVALIPEPLSLTLFGVTTFSNEIRWAAPWVATAMLSPIVVGVLMALDRHKRLLMIGAVQSLLVIGVVPIVAWQWGVGAAALGQGLAGAVAIMLGLRAAGVRTLSFRMPALRATDSRLMLSCVIPSAIGGLAWTWSQTLAIGFVVRDAGSAVPVGEFALSQQLFSLASFIPLSAAIGLAPMFHQAFAAGDHQKSSRLVRLSILAAAVYGLCAWALIWALAGPVASAFGHSYSSAVGEMRIMGPVAFLASMHGLMGHFTQATHRYWRWAIVNLASGIVNVLSVYFLVGHVEDVLAWGWLVAFSVGVAIALPMTLKFSSRISAPTHVDGDPAANDEKFEGTEHVGANKDDTMGPFVECSDEPPQRKVR